MGTDRRPARGCLRSPAAAHGLWTDVERAAYDAQAACPREASAFLSPLLRRIRATAGPGPVNSTDTWTSGDGVRLETTDGPPCPDLIRLLTDGPCALGWEVEYKVCTCLCDHSHASLGCTIDFRDPATGRPVWYANLKWAACLGVSERPQHDQGRLRPGGEVEGEQQGLLARLDLFDRPPPPAPPGSVLTAFVLACGAPVVLPQTSPHAWRSSTRQLNHCLAN